jgi:hypothetical protein
LIKVLLFELMRKQFDYGRRGGVVYLESDECPAIPVVREIADALKLFQTKLAGAFARIRIERRASGKNSEEQLSNILPEEIRRRDSVAGMGKRFLPYKLPSRLTFKEKSQHAQICSRKSAQGKQTGRH